MKYNEKQVGKNIRKERKLHNYTQEELGEILGCSGKQISKYEQAEPLPSTSTLLDMCDLFGCELGYLLGEEEYDNKNRLTSAIEKYSGLTAESVSSIRAMSYMVTHTINYKTRESEILNNLLSNKAFKTMFEALVALDKCYTSDNANKTSLRERIGADLYDEAWDIYASGEDYEHSHYGLELRPEVVDAILLIEDEIDRREKQSAEVNYPTEVSVKMARYDAVEAFCSLINSLYPLE